MEDEIAITRRERSFRKRYASATKWVGLTSRFDGLPVVQRHGLGFIHCVYLLADEILRRPPKIVPEEEQASDDGHDDGGRASVDFVKDFDGTIRAVHVHLS